MVFLPFFHRPESQVIQGIVEKVLSELNGTSSSCVRQSKDFVGMDFHVKAVESDLGLQWECGMMFERLGFGGCLG